MLRLGGLTRLGVDELCDIAGQTLRRRRRMISPQTGGAEVMTSEVDAFVADVVGCESQIVLYAHYRHLSKCSIQTHETFCNTSSESSHLRRREYCEAFFESATVVVHKTPRTIHFVLSRCLEEPDRYKSEADSFWLLTYLGRLLSTANGHHHSVAADLKVTPVIIESK